MDSETHIEYKQCDGITYACVSNKEVKQVIAAGIAAGNSEISILDQTEYAFETMSRILKQEAMTFSDIVRQWNYIEQIVSTRKLNEGLFQNYQVFNDVRSKFYSQTPFEHGFPAATGIGRKFRYYQGPDDIITHDNIRC